MELYLITGFLGAGKTTFLKNFARQFAGRRLRLIINEFGRAGVDGTLLNFDQAEADGMRVVRREYGFKPTEELLEDYHQVNNAY